MMSYLWFHQVHHILTNSKLSRTNQLDKFKFVAFFISTLYHFHICTTIKFYAPIILLNSSNKHHFITPIWNLGMKKAVNPKTNCFVYRDMKLWNRICLFQIKKRIFIVLYIVSYIFTPLLNNGMSLCF